jgi:hypothetical protein
MELELNQYIYSPVRKRKKYKFEWNSGIMIYSILISTIIGGETEEKNLIFVKTCQEW